MTEIRVERDRGTPHRLSPGRSASAARGIVTRVWRSAMDDDVMGQAAKVAFFAFLALPPSLMVLFSVTAFVDAGGAAAWLTERLERTVPGSATDPESASAVLMGLVEEIVHQPAPGPLSFGLLVAVWAASNVFMALGDALNRAYDIGDRRSWIRRRLISIGVLVATIVLFLGGSFLVLAGPAVAGWVGLDGGGAIWPVLQWAGAFLLVVGAFWIVYYVLPNRDQAADRVLILRGAAIGTGLWLLATAGFRLYIANFGAYSDTYGALGAVIVLLLWLYVTAAVVLLGGEINSEIPSRRRDQPK